MNGSYGGFWVCGEGFSCGSWFEFAFFDQVEGRVSNVGESLRGLAGADPAGVFLEGDVAHVKQAIFDLPVIARQFQQPGGVHFPRRYGSDGVDDLPGAQRFCLAGSFDPHDLRQAGPVLIEIGGQFGANRDAPDFNAAMPGIGMLKPDEIGRIDPLEALAGLAGEP